MLYGQLSIIPGKTRLYGLAYAGALDCFLPPKNRSVVIDNLEEIEKWRDKRLKPPTKTGKVFTDPLVLPPYTEPTPKKLIQIAVLEKEAVGDFITWNPLSLYPKARTHQRTELEEFSEEEIKRFVERQDRFHKKIKALPEVYGLVLDVKKKTSARGNDYKAVTVDLGDRTVSFSVFDNKRFIVNNIYRIEFAVEHRSPDYLNLISAEDVTPKV